MPYVTEYVFVKPKPRPLKRLTIWVSILTMLSALVLLAMPFWPRASYTVHKVFASNPMSLETNADEAQAPGSGNWLVIPSIAVKTPIVEGADVGVLDHKEGIWHQTGEAGEGNLVLAGHRFKYLPPNQTTFYNLDLLKAGDTITLWWNGQRYNYSVAQSSTVKRTAIEILNPTPHPQLTLYTCTDLAASKRLVVIADPV